MVIGKSNFGVLALTSPMLRQSQSMSHAKMHDPAGRPPRTCVQKSWGLGRPPRSKKSSAAADDYCPLAPSSTIVVTLCRPSTRRRVWGPRAMPSYFDEHPLMEPRGGKEKFNYLKGKVAVVPLSPQGKGRGALVENRWLVLTTLGRVSRESRSLEATQRSPERVVIRPI